ncbi:MAG: phosphatidylinositol-specific phospholipase C [Akkermansiaceae bacterium]|nr:phosphatidylinositol-specific phospholipase C [Akkermansiaceae bacterium]MCP5548770.1 phosphatidylinositol-specific phospholipase C [Akkermansiaceae bacterium]
MKLHLFLFLTLIAMATGAPDGAKWMSRLGDRRPLGALSIPGSHNAAARFEPVRGTAKCQKLTIASQLEAGVRVLDIRCRHVADDFRIHHGPVDQKTDFARIVATCIGFLDEHPRETIVIMIQQEATPKRNSRSFEATFDEHVAKHRGRWWLRARIPTLGEARGKLVLLRRFHARNLPKGIDATAWTDFERATKETTVRVQDRFRVDDNDEKWRLFLDAFRKNRKRPAGTLFLNYASGYRPGALGIPNIRAVSDDLNPRLRDHLRKHPDSPQGIVMMDFADAETAALIYQTNRRD